MAERWLTYQQAGDALGMTAEAVRQRARRLGWRTQPGNEGRALVLVPDGVEVRPRDRPAVQPELRAQLDRAEGESRTLREQVESERGRAERAEARAGQAEREREVARIAAAAAGGEAKVLRERMEQAEHRADRAEALRERAEKAEARADQAEEEARRPFWRRWLG